MDQKQHSSVIQRNTKSVLATNSVIRNTYLLLALTLIFSAVTAWLSMSFNAQPNFIIFLVGMFGLSMLTAKLRNSRWGLLSIFAFTGFMGYVLGPILNMYLHTYINGFELVMTAMAGTGVIFFVLSAYALLTQKDFSYMGGFLCVAFTTAFIAGLAGVFFNMPILQLLVSGAFILLSSGYILFTTSRIIDGGERNYIMATMSLFVAIFNIFISLLNILSAFSGRR